MDTYALPLTTTRSAEAPVSNPLCGCCILLDAPGRSWAGRTPGRAGCLAQSGLNSASKWVQRASVSTGARALSRFAS